MATAKADGFFSLRDPVAKHQAAELIERYTPSIVPSERYRDDAYEYRHVRLPKALAHLVPRSRLMSEAEWRQLGVQQSVGWEHYMLHSPEPHVLLFKRALG